MFSQLDTSIDLNDDTKQAANIYNEQRDASKFQHKRAIDLKDASTQTINSKGKRFFDWSGYNEINENNFLIVSREEKSLGIMAQKFLMLFLTAEVC